MEPQRTNSNKQYIYGTHPQKNNQNNKKMAQTNAVILSGD